MKVDVTLPLMGESVTEGTIAKWLKKPGDHVERDEAILEITTDKIDTEIPSPEDGTVSEILVEEGETVEVGAVLARIETDAEQPKVEEKPRAKTPLEKKGERKEQVEEKEPLLSPVVKNIAAKEGLSLEELRKLAGTGPGRRVTKEDVISYLDRRKTPKEAAEAKKASARPAEPALRKFAYDVDQVQIVPMSPMRKQIAEHMVYSKRTSPHVYTVAEIDLTRIVNFRERNKREFEQEEGVKLTYTPFILDATVQALKQWPMVNASVEGDNIIVKEYINLGVAVAVDEGLIVPVIKNADEKNLLGLARAAGDLARRAREKKLKPEDVQDGTFTVTNPGIFGNLFGMPVINQPQLGILGVGAIKKRPVVLNDAIAIRSMMYVTLSYDHRAIDGALAGRFLQTIVRNLEEYDVDQAL